MRLETRKIDGVYFNSSSGFVNSVVIVNGNTCSNFNRSKFFAIIFDDNMRFLLAGRGSTAVDRRSNNHQSVANAT